MFDDQDRHIGHDNVLLKGIDSVSAFTKFCATAENIKNVHRIIASDVNLALLAEEFTDIQLLDSSNTCFRKVLKNLCLVNNSSPLVTVLSRILVCKPHSADCERLISAYNRLKSLDRASLSRQTISDYLHINVNMPPLGNFDARAAVLKWFSDKHRRQNEPCKASKQS